MKTTHDIKLTTAGKLLGELKKYEKEHWDYSVVAWIDDHTVGVVGIGKDKDKDLRIEVEEVEEEMEGIWTVADVIQSLERCDKYTRVYLAGHGYYFAIDSKGSAFTDTDDDEVIGCYATIFGKYHEEPPCLFTEEERRQRERNAIRRERKERWKGIIEGVTFLLSIPLVAYALYYNIASLVKHTMPVWECVIYIIILGLLLYVCIDNLIFPEHKD